MEAIYDRWRACAALPIECLVNVALLYAGAREIVQLDLTYYDDAPTVAAVRALLLDCAGAVVVREDRASNLIVYLEARRRAVEARLRAIGGGAIDAAPRTAGFARLLDRQFYGACRLPLPRLFAHADLLQVSINVIADERRVGSVLVMMCRPRDVRARRSALHRCFARYSALIRRLDPALQTSLVFHAKPGRWKDSPEYAVDRMRRLRALPESLAPARAAGEQGVGHEEGEQGARRGDRQCE